MQILKLKLKLIWLILRYQWWDHIDFLKCIKILIDIKIVKYTDIFGRRSIISEMDIDTLSAMRRAVNLINRILKDDYMAIAESELGAKYDPDLIGTGVNHELLIKSDELENQDWDQFWDIISGRNNEPGSNIKHWWL